MKKPKINKIRAYREALNLSQKEMGKLINVHHVVYSRKERKIVKRQKVFFYILYLYSVKKKGKAKKIIFI